MWLYNCGPNQTIKKGSEQAALFSIWIDSKQTVWDYKTSKFCIIKIWCCVLSKLTVIQLNLQRILLVIASRLTPCYTLWNTYFMVLALKRVK